MTDLNDVEALRALDAGDMLGAVASLPRHAREGYAAGRTAERLASADGVTAVLFCGMGGSAVAGDVLRSLFRSRLVVPVEVNRNPELPAYAGPHTLVVISSYSGNTAETLACFEEAVARGCRVLPITSGGTLADRADELGLGAVTIAGGYMPRAALGYLAMSLLGAMESVGLLPVITDDVAEATDELDRLVEALGPELPTDRNDAKTLAERIGHRQPVVWGADGFGSVAAARWKTQLNENGKVPAWSAALPELDHNEVVGWFGEKGASSFVIALRHAGEHPDVGVRFPISLEIARDAGVFTEEVWATGSSELARFLSLVVMGDYVSCYVGLRQGLDPSPIASIDRLKAFLDAQATS
ncbi:MAG: bifunctional phosphoglucose/phosphomannose isomerase [Actinomycetota bacterium]|nr:bifunctional phosphoglucose/phosphomannose isomerase [Actinomycetota bacterium]MDH5224348.1 bifunctional phosphoglucose/phosphomannose isomerase [Actinomycetota bacterium]